MFLFNEFSNVNQYSQQNEKEISFFFLRFFLQYFVKEIFILRFVFYSDFLCLFFYSIFTVLLIIWLRLKEEHVFLWSFLRVLNTINQMKKLIKNYLWQSFCVSYNNLLLSLFSYSNFKPSKRPTKKHIFLILKIDSKYMSHVPIYKLH